MATTTLTLYKHTKLDDMKNFVVDDIENYLSTKTKETITDFQYQKFELNKTIKLNKSQSYLLKGASLNKYDYLKISTGTLNYYYFILRASWKAEETIELDIKMDTLNTFGFSNVASDSTYTLSNKTLVKREHKDRLERLPVQYVSRDLTDEERFAISELDSNNYYQNTSDEDVHLLINSDGLKEFANGQIIDITFILDNGSYIYYQGNKYEDIRKLRVFAIGLGDKIQFIDNNFIPVLTININNLVSNLILVIPSNANTTQSIDSGDWTQLVNLMYYTNASVTIEENKYKRIIDHYQEGLSTILFKQREQPLLDEDENNQWYVLYTSTNNVTDNNYTTYINPVKIRFYSDNGYSISAQSSREVSLSATSPLIPKWNYTSENLYYWNPNVTTPGLMYIKINGVTYDYANIGGFHAKRKNNNDIVFEYVAILNKLGSETARYNNVESIIFYGINQLYVEGKDFDFKSYSTYIYINSGTSSYTGTCDKWEDLDLTDSRFIKAFAFPYCPCSFMVGKSQFTELPDSFSFSTDDYIQLDKVQKFEFKYQKNFKVASPLSNINLTEVDIGTGKVRDIKYESKLYHSDFFQPKFVYDSFSFMFALERVNVDIVNDSYVDLENNFYCTYVVSRNVQSKFAFIFDEYFLDKGLQDYENVLTIERNNEKALYNNSYINYIRSGGYNYDNKKASSQNAVNGISTALSIVGSVGSLVGGFASANPILLTTGVGLAVGGVTGIMRSIHTAQEQDRAISQKVNQAVLQGTSVQGSEDIDILTSFSGNKAKLCYYELSNVMKQAMWDLFHYCGYATHEQKIPDVTTRLYFNFVQAEIVYDEFTFNEDIADDIRNKWKEGVTFFHKVNGEWDIEQQYENFEVSLI